MRYNLSIAAGPNVLAKVEEKILDEMQSSDKADALRELIKKIVDGCIDVAVDIKDDVISLVVETKEVVLNIVEMVERFFRNKYHRHITVTGDIA